MDIALPWMNTIVCNQLDELYWTGPSLDQGPLPALIYLSLAGDESLSLNPFNQPIQWLADKPIRCFSLTLPCHGKGFDKSIAMEHWANLLRENHLLTPFLNLGLSAINKLVNKNLIQWKQLALAGLSRGAFAACHLAAHLPNCAAICGFAPLTELTVLKEFRSEDICDRATSWGLGTVAEKLAKIPSRLYIGNNDTRVGTEACFAFHRQLVAQAHSQRLRPAPHELCITPSIGHKGHGTTPEVFANGAAWVWDRLRD